MNEGIKMLFAFILTIAFIALIIFNPQIIGVTILIILAFAVLVCIFMLFYGILTALFD